MAEAPSAGAPTARAGGPLAAFLLAAAGLLAELAWTRVAGLLFFGDAAYLIVSLAVAGLAAGAAVGAARPALLRPGPRAAAAAGAGVAVAGGLLIALALAGRGGLGAALAAAAPGFVLLGLALAGVFAGDPAHAPRLYRADLLGAAAGAAASLPLLGGLGAPDAALVGAAAAALAGTVLAPSLRPAPRGRGATSAGVEPRDPHAGRGATRFARLAAAPLAGVAAVAALTPWPDAPAARLATPKPMTRELARGGGLVASGWGTLGRSDLLRRADGAEILYLNGGAGSLLPTASTARLWRDDLGRFAFEALAPERVFVVGGGAGLEVAHALETGAERVVAAEVNGAGIELARERLARDRAGGAAAGDDAGGARDAGGAGGAGGATAADPFRDRRVAWRRDEARSVLAADGGPFDLIAVSQAVTRTVEARRSALTENGLYTVEALRGYLAALAPGGAVAFELYDELTLTRTVVTAVAAIAEGGVREAAAMARLLAVLDRGTTPPTPLLLVFREPLSPERAVAIAREAEAAGLALLYVPGLPLNPALDAVAEGRRTVASLVAAAEGVDLSPTHDDAPFFWSFEPGLPAPLRRVLAVLGIAAALTAAAVAVAGRGAPGARRATAHVGLLGVAFLALEIVVLSRTQLLLGHPAAALAVTLGGLLAGGGIGSGLARRRPDAWPAVARATLVAGAAAAAWTLAWPALAAGLTPAAAPVRAAGVLVAVVPLGVALGMPFPLALRRVGAGAGARPVATAWAVNGLGSLLGGAGATALAHLAGFRAASLAAVALYLVAAGTAAALAAAAARGPGTVTAVRERREPGEPRERHPKA